MVNALRSYDPVFGFAQAERVNKYKVAQLSPVNSAQTIPFNSAC